MALINEPQQTYKLEETAIDFSLPGTDGKTYSLSSFSEAKVLVVIFTCNHCPYAQAYTPRLVKLQKEFSKKSVQFVGINPNDAEKYPDDSFENMKEFAKEYVLNFPYLQDETQETAAAYNAVCTPDIFVFDSERKLRYRGKVDDSNPYDKPETAKNFWLKEAIEFALGGKSPKTVFRPVIGCSIKWRPGNQPTFLNIKSSK